MEQQNKIISHKKIKNKINNNKSLFFYISVTLLCIYSLSIILPMVWALMTSLKSDRDFRISVFGLPSTIKWSNYSKAFEVLAAQAEVPGGGTRWVYLWELFGNTIIYSIGATLFAIITPAITAYAVAKYKFKLRNVLYNVVIITMLLPIVGSLPSSMLVMQKIGFYDNLFGVWITKGTFLGMDFLILYATFKSLSWEYAEAGFIDGASNFTVMTRIMFPLVRTTIMALALLAFIGFWNDYQTQLIYLPSFPSVSYALFRLQFNSLPGARYVTIQLAGCMLVSLPVFTLFMFTKKLFIGNLAVGGIKG